MTAEEYKLLNPVQKVEARRTAKKLWTLEVMYFQHGKSEVCLHKMRNLFPFELMALRETIFAAGLYVPVDPGHGLIIAPSQFRQIDVFVQKSFIETPY